MIGPNARKNKAAAVSNVGMNTRSAGAWPESSSCDPVVLTRNCTVRSAMPAEPGYIAVDNALGQILRCGVVISAALNEY